MNKIKVNICTNKACFISGATLFKQLNLIMSASLKSKVILRGTECECFERVDGKDESPYASVNGKLITHATAGLIIQEIQNELRIARKNKSKMDEHLAVAS